VSSKIRNSLERDDWKFIRGVCCATAANGDPIDPARWPFFGEWWIAAYEKLRPEWTYVAEREDGIKLGYLTGCPDTREFDRQKRFLADWPLYLKIRSGVFTPNGDTQRWVSRFQGKDRWPEQCFNPEATADVLARYPAHLHINLTTEARGSGTGRALMERYFEDLRAQGVPGVHLYCGDKPLPFYFKTGFRELDRIEFRPGAWVYRLVREL